MALRVVVLVPIELFVGQFGIQIVFHEGKTERILNIVWELALKLVEALHLDDQDAWHYVKKATFKDQRQTEKEQDSFTILLS